LNVGDVVTHASFGQGTVVDMEGDIASVYFVNKGTKKLNTSFGLLKKAQ